MISDHFEQGLRHILHHAALPAHVTDAAYIAAIRRAARMRRKRTAVAGAAAATVVAAFTGVAQLAPVAENSDRLIPASTGSPTAAPSQDPKLAPASPERTSSDTRYAGTLTETIPPPEPAHLSIGEAKPYTLLLHCGIRYIELNGLTWEGERQVKSHTEPGSSDLQKGLLVLRSGALAIFISPGQPPIRFHPSAAHGQSSCSGS